MKIKYGFFCLGLIMLVNGCASSTVMKLDAGTFSSYSGEKIAVIQRPMPDFSMVDTGKSRIRNITGLSDGQYFLAGINVSDPAYSIAEKIGKNLEQYNIQYVGMGRRVIVNDDITLISEKYADFPLVIDVKTIDWSLKYFPVHWSRYRVTYTASLKVIDTRKKKIISSGTCEIVPGYTDDAPGYEEMMENHAERFKQEIAAEIDQCVSQISGPG